MNHDASSCLREKSEAALHRPVLASFHAKMKLGAAAAEVYSGTIGLTGSKESFKASKWNKFQVYLKFCISWRSKRKEIFHNLDETQKKITYFLFWILISLPETFTLVYHPSSSGVLADARLNDEAGFVQGWLCCLL